MWTKTALTQLLEIPASVLTDLSSQHPTVAIALKKFKSFYLAGRK